MEPIHAATPQNVSPSCIAHEARGNSERFRKITAAWPGQNDSMAILPGESLCLAAEEIQGRVVNFKPAPPDYPDAQILRVKLARTEDGGFVLVIKNPMSRWLHVNATLMRNDPQEVTPAQLSLVGPGTTNTEIFKPVEADFVVIGKAELTDAAPNAPPTAR